jgi:predicted phosphoribosyltransferase
VRERSAGLFADRREAGQELAGKLRHYAHRDDVIVLGLPRGGVPVAFAVAGALDAPLDVFVVRKLGVPGHEELAMGAVASGGVRVLNDSVIAALGISAQDIDRVTAAERRELERRERSYRGDRQPLSLAAKIVLLIDDGLATGASMRAALAGLRAHRPARVVVAVPVAPEETCAELRAEADEVVCAGTPDPFLGVGAWYKDFSPTRDEEVRSLLEAAAAAAVGRGD